MAEERKGGRKRVLVMVEVVEVVKAAAVVNIPESVGREN